MTQEEMRDLNIDLTCDSESFQLGFECGHLWATIRKMRCVKKEVVHTKNADKIEVICCVLQVEYRMSRINDFYSLLTVWQKRV